MVYAPPCYRPKSTGLIHIKVASPTTGTLLNLGEAYDMVDTEDRAFFHDVHSDRNGGPQGSPVEVQYLGAMIVINFTLSMFNQTTVELLHQRGVNVTPGTIAQNEIGQFMLQDKSVRLLLDTNNPLDVRNYPCCLVRDPIRVGSGTKFSQYVFSFTAYRGPCGHPKADVLWDKDAA